jgi:hypothetical protein
MATIQTWLFWTAVALLLLLAIPMTRAVVIGLFSTFLTPGFLGTLRVICLWVWWVLKRLVLAHLTIAAAFMKSHKNTFPTLDQEAERKPRS